MDTDQPSKAIYDCFVLSGGGSKGAYGAGAAKAVEEYRKLRGLTNPVCYIGASAGALNAYILAAGDADALIDFWLTTTNKAILGVPNGNSKIHAAWRYFQQCFSSSPRSLYSNKAITRLIRENATLPSLHSALIVAATDYTRGRLRAFYASDLIDTFVAKDREAEPRRRRLSQFRRIEDDQMLVAALLASAAIPFFFPPVEITAKDGDEAEAGWFIDGGVGNNTPTREAAYFLRFLAAEGAGEPGVTFCVKQEQPRTIQDETGRLELADVLLRTLDVYHDVHTRPIIGAWNRINSEVAEQNAAIRRFSDWLNTQGLPAATVEQIIIRLRQEVGMPGGQAPRLDMPLLVVAPSISLGDTLDFNPARAREEIKHGYGDMLKVLSSPIDADHPHLDDAEFDKLINRPLFSNATG